MYVLIRDVNGRAGVDEGRRSWCYRAPVSPITMVDSNAMLKATTLQNTREFRNDGRR